MRTIVLSVHSRLWIWVLILGLAAAPPAAGQAVVEVEADPIAYAFDGFSLHVASVLGRNRLSVGTFGIDVPRALHGNEGWSSRMRGVGVKWDYIGRDLDGWFGGVDAGYMRMTYTLEASAAAEKRGELNLGVRAGYRLPVGGRGFYLSPWVGVIYNVGGGDVVIDGQRFEHGSITLFPTVHVGWRF